MNSDLSLDENKSFMYRASAPYQLNLNLYVSILRTDPFTKRFFPQGEQQSGTPFYYTFDHEHSVREMCNSSGSIVAQYGYDPFGRTTLVSGSNIATFQFTGDYTHQSSGLYLTRGGIGSSTGRFYDPATARWGSRDPFKNAEIKLDPNLYEYAKNDPILYFDPLGLNNQSGNGTVWSAGGGFFFGFGGEGGIEKVHLDNCTCQWYIYAGTGFGALISAGTQMGYVGNVYQPSDYAGSFYTAQGGAGVAGATASVAPGNNTGGPGSNSWLPGNGGAQSGTGGIGRGIKDGAAASYRFYLPIGQPFKCNSAVPGL